MDLSSTTTLQVDSSTGTPGTVINGEDQLGLSKSDIEPKFQVMVRAGSRNRIWLRLLHARPNRQRHRDRADRFRDAVLQVGDPLQSQLNFRVLGLTYGYSFWHSEKLEFAATLGADSGRHPGAGEGASAGQHVNQMKDVAGPFPDAGSRCHLGGEQAILFRRTHPVPEPAFRPSRRIARHAGIRRALPIPAQRVLRARLHRHQGSSLGSARTRSGGYLDLDTKGPQFFVRVAF